MKMSRYNLYSTPIFTDIWSSAESFKTDFEASPFRGAISATESATTKDNVSLLYYLLYARYGNNPIANMDEEQFKFKVYSVIFQYGPTWEKKLAVQEKLRALSEDDLLQSSKAIYNHAFNPSDAPGTGTLEELEFINDQNTTNYKRSKLDAYGLLWQLLNTDVTEAFLTRFKICFKKVVFPDRPVLYEEDEDDD